MSTYPLNERRFYIEPQMQPPNFSGAVSADALSNFPTPVTQVDPKATVRAVLVKGLTIPVGQQMQLVDSVEHGQLLEYELRTDTSLLASAIRLGMPDGATFDPFLYHPDPQTMLTLGHGLGPGDVKKLPDGTSPDPHGEPSAQHPYLSRYKATTEADINGITGQMYAIMWVPTAPVRYERINAYLTNNGSAAATVFQIVVLRKIFLD